MLEAWLGAFVLTQCVECPLYKRALDPGTRPWLKAFSVSALTHPMLFLVIPMLLGGQPLRPLWLVEGIVVGIEFALLRRMGVQSALFWALTANGASLLIGGITRSIWGWP